MNVTIPFETEVDEMGVMYFEAKDPTTGDVEHYVSCSPLANSRVDADAEDSAPTSRWLT